MRLLLVKWYDAETYNGWETKKEINKDLESFQYCLSVGWEMKNTKKFLVLVADRGQENDSDDAATNRRLTLPKPWVQSIEVLREDETKPKAKSVRTAAGAQSRKKGQATVKADS